MRYLPFVILNLGNPEYILYLKAYLKWAKDSNRHCSKDDIHKWPINRKLYSISLSIREMQIKTTMKYYLTPIKMATI